MTEARDIVQETGIKTIPKKKKCKKVKWLSEEALQRAVKREVKRKGEKERYTYWNVMFYPDFSDLPSALASRPSPHV